MDEDLYDSPGGVQAPPQQAQPPLPSMFTQADSQELQQLQQGLTETRRKLNRDEIDPELAAHFQRRLVAEMQPLLESQQQAQEQAEQSQVQQAMKQQALQTSMLHANMAQAAKLFPDTIARHGDKQFYQSEPGKWAPVEERDTKPVLDAFLARSEEMPPPPPPPPPPSGGEGSGEIGDAYSAEDKSGELHIYNGTKHDVGTYDENGRLVRVQHDVDNPENSPENLKAIANSALPAGGKKATAEQLAVAQAFKDGGPLSKSVIEKAQQDTLAQQLGRDASRPIATLTEAEKKQILDTVPKANLIAVPMTHADFNHNAQEKARVARDSGLALRNGLKAKEARIHEDSMAQENRHKEEAAQLRKETPGGVNEKPAFSTTQDSAIRRHYEAEVAKDHKFYLGTDANGRVKHEMPAELATPEARAKEATARYEKHMESYKPKGPPAPLPDKAAVQELHSIMMAPLPARPPGQAPPGVPASGQVGAPGETEMSKGAANVSSPGKIASGFRQLPEAAASVPHNVMDKIKNLDISDETAIDAFERIKGMPENTKRKFLAMLKNLRITD